MCFIDIFYRYVFYFKGGKHREAKQKETNQETQNDNNIGCQSKVKGISQWLLCCILLSSSKELLRFLIKIM